MSCLSLEAICAIEFWGGSSEALGVVLLLALVPLVMVVAGAYIKFSVVLGLMRSALGVSELPSPVVTAALSMVFSLALLAPVIEESADTLLGAPLLDGGSADGLEASFEEVAEPWLLFLEANTEAETEARYWEALGAKESAQGGARLRALLPAFLTHELTEAFQIGFLLLLPFLLIDIIVAALLQAGGLTMTRPHVIALPFKLLLFVIADGWQLLLEGMLLGYS